MDWIYVLFGIAALYIHLIGIHASGKNQEAKGSPYWHGVLLGMVIPYYSFFCWYKYRSKY